MSSGTSVMDRRSTEREVRLRRQRALARLADRREVEAVRRARTEAMRRHPSSQALAPARRARLGLDEPLGVAEVTPVRLHVVGSLP